ncbi:hypothetical protein DFJ74DRAFT_702912 [Hyaloraphidium curvatum]|nr:hypothetical protein DFJ74DRAFT_702912 [Hyaloraphidium curvatum]
MAPLPGTPDAAPVGGTLALVSQVCGWGYVLAWAVSLYPQPLRNWRRKSVRGYSFDYIVLYVFGFVALAIYTFVFFFDRGVQDEYSRRNGGLKNLVVTADLLHICHSLAISLFTMAQCWVYDHDPLVLKGWTKLFIGLASSAALLLTFWIGTQHLSQPPSGGNGPVPAPVYPDWIDLMYFFSAVKLAVSCIQSIPQLLLNASLRSTRGFAVGQVWLDAAGAVLSLVQLFADAAIGGGDWVRAGIAGNPAKLGTGVLSLAFDAAFLVQRYVLYAGSGTGPAEVSGAVETGGEVEEDWETDPLLRPRSRGDIASGYGAATLTAEVRQAQRVVPPRRDTLQTALEAHEAALLAAVLGPAPASGTRSPPGPRPVPVRMPSGGPGPFRSSRVAGRMVDAGAV